MRTRQVMLRVAVAGALVVGCGEPPVEPDTQQPPETAPPEGPLYPGSAPAPELLEVRPSAAAAGETVELHVTQRTGRGRVYALERQNDHGWQWAFSLTSDVHSFTWWYAGHEVATPDDVHYDTTVTVPLPSPAEPGDYRICTSNGDCAELAIE